LLDKKEAKNQVGRPVSSKARKPAPPRPHRLPTLPPASFVDTELRCSPYPLQILKGWTAKPDGVVYMQCKNKK